MHLKSTWGALYSYINTPDIEEPPLSQSQKLQKIAVAVGVTLRTVKRWLKEKIEPNAKNLEALEIFLEGEVVESEGETYGYNLSGQWISQNAYGQHI